MSEPKFPGGDVWVPDRSWSTPATHVDQCAHGARCHEPPVAELDRYHMSDATHRGRRYMGWCAKHMGEYLRINGDVVEVRVGADSPAARRGWTR